MGRLGCKYLADMYEQYLIDFCQQCKFPDCPGICTGYKNEYLRHHGLPLIQMPVVKNTNVRPLCDWHKKGRFEAFGEVHSLAYWCKKFGISYNTAYMRIYRYNMPIEEALTAKRQFEYKRVRYYEIDGEVHTLKEWAAIKGIPKKAIGNRLARGWDYRRAIEEPLQEKYRRNKDDV